MDINSKDHDLLTSSCPNSTILPSFLHNCDPSKSLSHAWHAWLVPSYLCDGGYIKPLPHLLHAAHSRMWKILSGIRGRFSRRGGGRQGVRRQNWLGWPLTECRAGRIDQRARLPEIPPGRWHGAIRQLAESIDPCHATPTRWWYGLVLRRSNQPLSVPSKLSHLSRMACTRWCHGGLYQRASTGSSRHRPADTCTVRQAGRAINGEPVLLPSTKPT